MPENEGKTPSTKWENYVVSPPELVALYDMLHEREWDKDRGAFKNPIVVMRSVLHYGRLAATRIVEAYKYLGALEARITALETFRQEIMVQSAEATRTLEEMMRQAEAPPPPILVEPAPTPPTPTPPASPDGSVIPIKPAASTPSKKQKGGDTA